MNEVIQPLLDKLHEIEKESISLPGDIMLGYSTRRSELLKVGQSDKQYTTAEVHAILDTLAGEMRMGDVRKQIISEMTTLVQLYRASLTIIVKRASEAANEIRGVQTDLSTIGYLRDDELEGQD